MTPAAHRAWAFYFVLLRDAYRAKVAAHRLSGEDETEALRMVSWCEDEADHHAAKGKVSEGWATPATCPAGGADPGGEAGRGVPPPPGSQTESQS